MRHSWLYVMLAMLCCSCDAMLILSYQVRNKTGEPLTLILDKKGTGMYYHGNMSTADTSIVLNRNERIQVRLQAGMGFPWETKKLFRMQRSSNNFKVTRGGTILPLDMDEKRWKYSRRRSTFTIRKRDLE